MLYMHYTYIYIDIYRVVMKVKKRFNLKGFNVSHLQLRSFALFLSLSLYILCMYVCIYIYIFILLINIVSDTEIKEKF